MATWTQLITEALIDLSVLERGEAARTTEVDAAFIRLKEMLDEWAAEGRTMPGEHTFEHTVTESKLVYTVGPTSTTPDLAVEFTDIDAIIYRMSFTESGGQHVKKTSPLEIDRYVRENLAGCPKFYAYEKTHPKARLLFDQPQRVGDKFTIIGSTYFIGTDAAKGDTIALPREYLRAIRRNLSIELAPSYGVQPDTVIIAEAVKGKSNIQVRNAQPIGLGLDPSLPGMRRGRGGNLYGRFR